MNTMARRKMTYVMNARLISRKQKIIKITQVEIYFILFTFLLKNKKIWKFRRIISNARLDHFH